MAFDYNSSPLIRNSLKKAEEQRNIPIIPKPSLVENNLAPVKPIAKPEDSLNFHGIPKSEMTPMVKAAFDSMMEEVKHLRNERVRLMDALRKAEGLADTDALTNTYNRRAFEREMGRVISFGQRYDIPSSLLFFDLDGFKKINDTYGHNAGDIVLINVAQVLKENVRESDLVGRIGGDEFVVLLAKADGKEAHIKGQNLLAQIRALRISFEDTYLTIGATLGIHDVLKTDSVETALNRADELMYSNKLSSKILSL